MFCQIDKFRNSGVGISTTEPLHDLSCAWRKFLERNLCAPRSQKWERVEKITHGLFYPKSDELCPFQISRGSDLRLGERFVVFHLAFVFEIWVSNENSRNSGSKSIGITQKFEMDKLQYNWNVKPRGCFLIRGLNFEISVRKEITDPKILEFWWPTLSKMHRKLSPIRVFYRKAS